MSTTAPLCASSVTTFALETYYDRGYCQNLSKLLGWEGYLALPLFSYGMSWLCHVK